MKKNPSLLFIALQCCTFSLSAQPDIPVDNYQNTYAARTPQKSNTLLAPKTAAIQPPGMPPASSPQSLFAGYNPVTLYLQEGTPFSYARMDGLFKHFEVIDERPDTARIGIHTTGRPGHTRTSQMVFGRPVAREVSNYLNRFFARPNAPFSCLVVLRTLWLSDATYIREELMKAPEKRFEKNRVRIKAEIYAVRDSVYMPLYRFDTLQISTRDSYRAFTHDLAALVDHLADSASIVMTTKRESGRLITRDDIRAFNQSRFDISIGRDTSLTPGVYASYEEFRNNAPSIKNYEIHTEANHLLVYTVETDGMRYYNHNAFGYCDGKNVYIMKDGILRPAWREGKAWYFFGKTPLERIATDDPASDPDIDQTGNYTVYQPSGELSRIRVFALDMDSGKVF